ncbi:unnamed protein product, partial [Ectocarpus fasciculatus]
VETEVLKRFGGWSHVTTMDGWVFQEVDFSHMDVALLLSVPMHGAMFWGCTFPAGVTDEDIRHRGAKYVMSNPDFLPFKPLRAFLYTPQELEEKDLDIYTYYKGESSVTAKLAYALHDFSMLDAIYDYAEGKTFVGVMGGHAVKRADPSYAQLVQLGHMVATAGFICITGGGPGAMEACNLGAYLTAQKNKDHSDSFASVDMDGFDGPDMNNTEAPRLVIERFGQPCCFSPSIGVPTWYYGHEPSNMFASYHAKFFQNSIREDVLLELCNGGLIIGPGGPGTIQEVFQACCKNAYTRDGIEYPMVFFGKQFWIDSGVWDVVVKQAKGHVYADLLLLSDDVHEIVAHV